MPRRQSRSRPDTHDNHATDHDHGAADAGGLDILEFASLDLTLELARERRW